MRVRARLARRGEASDPPILFSGLDKFWIKGQARRVVDWGRKDAACGMAEDDGVKMSGLRLDRPAAPRLGCARGVTGVRGLPFSTYALRGRGASKI